jgi:hypothetical protein
MAHERLWDKETLLSGCWVKSENSVSPLISNQLPVHCMLDFVMLATGSSEDVQGPCERVAILYRDVQADGRRGLGGVEHWRW